jgi:hypothetical protein
MKQTAVEWLFNKLWDTNHITQYTTQGVDSFELLEQAKAMEKQQIIEACNYGDFEELGEQYYNKTYNK